MDAVPPVRTSREAGDVVVTEVDDTDYYYVMVESVIAARTRSGVLLFDAEYFESIPEALKRGYERLVGEDRRVWMVTGQTHAAAQQAE